MKSKFLKIIFFKILFLIFGFLPLSANPFQYKWIDGDREQIVILNPNYIGEIEDFSHGKKDKKTKITPVADSKIKAALSKGRLPKSHLLSHSEVFEEGEGGRKMTLPGDIFVEFESSWTESKVREWAYTENLEIIEKLNLVGNIYRIKTDPGIQSLLLANRLLTHAGVKSAFPNWWRESAPR